MQIFLNSGDISSTGHWGDPGPATPEKAAAVAQRVVDFVAAFVEKFKTMDV